MQIIVLEGRDLERFADVFNYAAEGRPKVRISVDSDGVKIDGKGTGGWTPGYGRPADETGH